jgi:hypothetical protein
MQPSAFGPNCFNPESPITCFNSEKYQMPWPKEEELCGFRETVERYSAAMEHLGMLFMLPSHAR